VAKLPDPAVPCEARWSRYYTPDADQQDPGSICGRPGRWMVVLYYGLAFHFNVFCCSHHKTILTDEWVRRRLKIRVWYLLKRRAKSVF